MIQLIVAFVAGMIFGIALMLYLLTKLDVRLPW
jgi:hypothetical protein